MVVQGGFSLQLIDAETQKPLNEYRGPSGSVFYAEARPGGEYFLRFQVLQEDTKTEAGSQETVMYFRPAVDGKDLGFYTNLTKSQGARDVGLWTYVNGIGTNQALKFETASMASTGNEQTSPPVVTQSVTPGTVSEEESPSTADRTTKAPPLLHMGNVQVQVFKAVFTGHQKRVYTSVPDLTREETVIAADAAPISASSSLQEEEGEDGTANGARGTAASKTAAAVMDPVPVLRSRKGGAKFQEELAEECPTYQPGELLETITIHYGSTPALIQAGILLPVPGVIPEYVGGPAPVSFKSETAPTIHGLPAAATVMAPKPLLDASSSSGSCDAKRMHSGTTESSKGASDAINAPPTKKLCLFVDPRTVVLPASAAVSTK